MLGSLKLEGQLQRKMQFSAKIFELKKPDAMMRNLKSLGGRANFLPDFK